MVVLKSKYKIKGSTLMETLVATVVIVIIFMMASLILNNLFSNTIKNNTQSIDNYLNELQYKKQNNMLQLPYQEDYENWLINISKFEDSNINYIEYEAINTETNKIILIVNEESN